MVWEPHRVVRGHPPERLFLPKCTCPHQHERFCPSGRKRALSELLLLVTQQNAYMKNAMINAYLIKEAPGCVCVCVYAQRAPFTNLLLIQRRLELQGIQGLTKPICVQIRGQRPVVLGKRPYSVQGGIWGKE